MTFALNVSTFSQLAVFTDATSLARSQGDPAAAYKVLSFKESGGCYLT